MSTIMINADIAEKDEDVKEKEAKIIKNLVLIFGLTEERAKAVFKDIDESLKKRKKIRH